MKLDNIKNRRAHSGAGGGGKPPRGPAPAAAGDAPKRPHDWRHLLTTYRFPDRKTVQDWALTDEECESILLNSPRNRAVIERGGSVRDDDMSAWYTVQHLGWACVKNGWSIVPQDRPGTGGYDYGTDTDQRKPARVPYVVKSGKYGNEEKTLYYAFLPTEWRQRRMSLREFLGFEHFFKANLALQCCAASGDIRVIDIDCTDPVIAARVRELAGQHLGETPFVRIGAAPKLQLIYRVEGEDVRIPKWSLVLGHAEDGQAVEFLAEGSIITAYGLHHKTMQSFDWSEGTLHPAIAGPEHAPLITKSQLRGFVNALQQEWTVSGGGVTSNPYGAKSAATQFDQRQIGTQRYWTPRVIEGDWTMDADGHVVDGAERWMTAQSWAVCAANAHRLPEVQGALIEWLAFEGKYKLLSSKRTNAKYLSEASIAREAAAKIRSASLKWRASIEHHERTGRYHDGVVPWVIGDDGRRPVAQRVRAGDRPADGSLDWIPDDACPIPELGDRSGSKVAVVTKGPEQVEADKTARALVPTKEERKRAGDRASAATIGHIGDWLATVPQWKPEAGPVAPWVIKGPTGVGKTAGTIDQLADFCRAHPRGPKNGPILLVLPTHANASEALEKAIEAGMSSPDAWTERQLELLEKDLKGRGVRIVRFRGREAAGCQRSTELRMLSDKGIGASRLCGAEVEDGDELDRRAAWKEGRKLPKVEILCPFREAGSCGYYNQMTELDGADIVVIPHAYLTISKLPKALRSPRAVIIDESVTYALLSQTRMPVSTLRLPRREPYVTKTDRKIWATWSDDDIKAHYVSGRENACSYAIEWLAAGKDVAVEFSKLTNGSDLVACAITMNERANDKTRKVRPDLTPAHVQAIADEASGRFILAEIRWWKTVRDRMERLATGMAKGNHDMRWQVVQHPETIVDGDETARIELTPHLRLSWRNQPNWSGFPTLLLDASANERIIAKLFAAAPEMRVVKAQQHGRAIAMIERTWSNSSFIPPWDASDDEIKRAAETIEQARRLITTIAVIYGHGRVLVGSTIAVREVINGGGWVPPPNVDFVHYGALRGLDFAKGHVAAISFGRSEQPIGVIDGYKAALTFDDDDPEEPYDKLGTGLTAEGKPLFRPASWSRIEMRTGEDVDHMVPSMPARPVLDARGRQVLEGKKLKTTRSWGQDLEESWREEEIRQFLGRLRLVYRSIDDDAPPPVWISVGKIIPSGTVIDEIVEMGSVLKVWPMAELVRLGGGVLSENVTPSLPSAQAILEGRTLKELAQWLPKGDAFLRRWAAPFAHARYRLDGSDVDRSAMLLPGWYEGGDIQDHWMGLSERYGLLPDVQRVSTPRLHSGPARRKPVDKRDVDGDWQLESEIWVRAAKPAEIGGAEFLIRHARGEYEVEDTDPVAPPAE